MNIEPYQDVVGKVAPDRAAGRLKARFVLTLRNRANAPAEVLLEAVDAEGECEFRFAQPSVTIDPGRGIEAPFTVFPPKQVWIGRPKDRPIRVTATPGRGRAAAATVAGDVSPASVAPVVAVDRGADRRRDRGRGGPADAQADSGAEPQAGQERVRGPDDRGQGRREALADGADGDRPER